MNLVPSSPPSIDPSELKTQRIATRIFVGTFLFSFVILLIYTSAVLNLKTFTISSPTLHQYQQLHQQYPQALTCPCSKLSIDYRSFIHINHSLHPVCSSFYVTDPWFDYITTGTSFIGDFRSSGPQLFRGLQSICVLAEESIQIALEQFNSTNLVTAAVESEDLLRSQAAAIIQQFITSTTNNFLLSLRLISNTTQVNALASALYTNAVLRVVNGNIYLFFTHRTYGGCFCGSHVRCTASLDIFENDDLMSAWSVPGFYVSCFILEALRASNLQCFFDQSCLDELQAKLQSNVTMELAPLASSITDRYDPTTAIGMVIDALMVQRWNWSISHASYYEKCLPNECSYTISKRNSLLSLLITMISTLGGLITAHKLIIPKAVNLVARCMRRRNRTVNSTGTSVVQVTKSSGTCTTQIDSLEANAVSS